jgi:hypothetical protein
VIEGIVVNLFSCLAVYYNKTNARRRCDWAAILIAETTHARTYGLLLHIKTSELV